MKKFLIPLLLLSVGLAFQSTAADGAITIYVGNLPYTYQSSDLEELFAQKGVVTSAQVIMDRDTGRSRGFGFVVMANSDEGRAAISEFNGQEVGGRRLNVNEARPRQR